MNRIFVAGLVGNKYSVVAVAGNDVEGWRCCQYG